MNTAKQIASLVLLSLTLHTFPENKLNQKSLWEKTIGSIATSYPMYWIEKNIEGKISFENVMFGDIPATPFYQELGKEAQYAVGIPKEYHVPIKKILPTNPMAAFVSALAFPNAIYVNEQKLNEQPYGVKRCAVYHEAIHKKYNDMTIAPMLEFFMFFGTMYGVHKILKSLQLSTALHVLGVVTPGVIATMIVCSKNHHYRERRADIEGFYATQCATCVQEMATDRHQKFEIDSHPLRNEGYLWAHEINLIAQDLQQQNKICAYHQFYNC